MFHKKQGGQHESEKNAVIFILLAGVLFCMTNAAHVGNIDLTYKYAWIENTGRSNFSPTGGACCAKRGGWKNFFRKETFTIDKILKQFYCWT